VIAFLGTYSERGSRGIYGVRFDPVAGAFGEPVVAAEASNPTFLALAPGGLRLLAVQATPETAAAFAIDPDSLILHPLEPLEPVSGPTPCHIALDATGGTIVTTNYHTGIVAAAPLRPDGSIGPPRVVRHQGSGPDPERQKCAHPHSSHIAPDNRFALVCDLGLDRIFTYALDVTDSVLRPARPPYVNVRPGSGPRHFAFATGGRQAYGINELDSTIDLFDYDAESGALTRRDWYSTLPAGTAPGPGAAEIAVHPSGRFVYASNRGNDTLAVYSVDPQDRTLTAVEIVSCGGKHPRHFALTPDGSWLLCAHRESDSLAAFRIDSATGRLTQGAVVAGIPAPICVALLPGAD